MFENLNLYAKTLHGNMVEVYWTLLPFVVLLLIVFELLKASDQRPSINDILRRTVISVLLLLSLNTVVNMIAMLSDSITDHIDQTQSLLETLKHLGPNSQGEPLSYWICTSDAGDKARIAETEKQFPQMPKIEILKRLAFETNKLKEAA